MRVVMVFEGRLGEGEVLLVRDCITREVVAATPQTTAAGALALRRGNGFRRLLVLRGGRFVGAREFWPPAGAGAGSV